MRAVDTNIVIRLLLRDDPAQAERVDALVAGGGLIIPHTVLIESEWVLRSAYRLDRATIAELLLRLTEIEGLSIPSVDLVRWAIGRHAAGADFADMIHLLEIDAEGFLTFDRALAASAGDDPPCPIETLG